MQKPILYTKDGYQELQKELTDLQEKRKSVVLEVKRTREMGDLSENAAYRAEKRKLGSVDSRLRFLNDKINRGKVVAPISNDTVQIGSKVTVSSNDKEDTYTIVGTYESDMRLNKISIFSPLGKGLLGKSKGQEVKLFLKNGVKIFTVSQIKSD